MAIRSCFTNGFKYGNVNFYTADVNRNMKDLQQCRHSFEVITTTFGLIQNMNYFVNRRD